MIAIAGIAIHSKIYESSASLVYRGIREQDNCAIVVKLLKQDYPSPQELTRYRQEYEITRSLQMEGVVKAYSQQDYQRTLIILLEDFGGESLERWMQQQPETFCPMPLATFLKLAIDLTDILGRIHAASIIHKDINPGNIVFNPATGVVKIIDFGIATRLNRTNPTFKSPHGLEGTLAYLSPEQTGRMNRSLDYRSDFYSLGVTFYELLTGQLPFSATDILELVHCHIAKQPISLHELNAAIPKTVSAIILKLMAKNAEDRYQSAWGIKADLERCAEQFTTTSQIDDFVLGLQDVSDQFYIPQKLYGRDAEITALLAAFDRVAGRNDAEAQRERDAEKDDISVEMMLVSGYSGVGKSALVQELYKPITEKRGYFISGKFDQFQRNIPYSAIVDALQKLVQQLLGEPDEQVQQWRSRLLTALGSNGQLLIDVIPDVELIIGKQSPVPDVGATEAQNRFNRVFLRFIRVFCSESHPLVIFLDDLQWIDSATLKLIELMLLDEQTQFLFLIGAYRDNEVSQTHPLALTLERLRKQGAVLQEIVLAPLKLEPLSQLIAETLHHNTDTVLSLAELVLQKTEGNPFFVNEFLKTLHAEDCLTFDVDRRNWQWDIEQIQAANITDNVVVLMTDKLSRLPESVEHILRLAACIGNEFDLNTLSMICESPVRELFSDLVIAVQTGLILPTSELDENLLIQNYRFLHDRVQQAAYSLIDESQKQVVHLQIGRDLLKKALPEQLSERLFEIVDHLNHGIEIVAEQAERTEIARLNLMAGQKALSATAYEAAFKYFNVGLKLLGAESWQHEYDLALALHSEAAEAAYLSGYFDEMEQFVEVVLNHAKTELDKVKAYDSRIQAYLSQGNLKEALKIGLKVLKLLEITLIETPSQLDIQEGLKETISLLVKREVEELINLPEMLEPKFLAAIHILANIVAAAFIVSPALLILIVCKMVNLSINHGNATWSPLSYAAYGLILCGILQDIELGYRFGKLALSLAERLDTKKCDAKVLEVLGTHIIYWKEHLKETLPYLSNSYQRGVENGDFEFAGYSAYHLCYSSFFVGQELTELQQKTATYSKAVSQIRRKTPFNWIAILWQTILNLRGQSEDPSRVIGSVYNEERALSNPAVAVDDGTGIHFLCLNKIILCYLFGDYYQAEQAAALLEQCLDGATGLLVVPLFHFYDSLVLLSIFTAASHSEKEVWLNRIGANQEKMKKWAYHAPMNYLHKYHLVEAEKARVLGQLFEAEEFYEQSILGASENEFIQEEALAYELAAKFYLERGRTKIAQTYIKEAHYCYERWGATAKVKDLEIRYSQFFPQTSSVTSTPSCTTSGDTFNGSDSSLDLAAVLKASQAISSEIELERLLSSLIKILVENAGAQIGYLILDNAGEWVIEASGRFNTNDPEHACVTQVLQSIPITNYLPESIVHYVIRTHESVILNDASHEGDFIHEPYIQQHQTQSIFCLPLLNQSKLVGILYLENQLAVGAFTSGRSQVLNLLSTQAAIAIENAKLYEKLRTSESQIANYNRTLEQQVAERTIALRQSEAEVRHREQELRLITDALPVCISYVDANRHYRFVNRTYEDWFGRSRKQILGNHIREILGEKAYQAVESYIDQVFTGQTVTLEVEMPLPSGKKYVNATLIPNVDGNAQVKGFYALNTDVSDYKQIEAALRDREQELQLIADALPALISYVDIEQRYRFVNRAYEVWFRRNRDEILGKTVREILGEAYPIAAPNIKRAQTGQITTYEAEISYPIGKRYISATFIPDIDHTAQIKGHYGLVTDISDRKRAEEASVLEERNRMAREIHDTLAQAFTGILAQVGAANQVLADDLEAAQFHLNLVKELARTGLTEARRSVTALRPQLLEEGSLQTALHRLVTQMRTATDTDLYYEIKGTTYPLPTEVESNLFRMGQEALTNAIKHANADEIRIELIYEAVHCRLRVQDNGQGFGVGSIPGGRFGLLGMSERAERIGAQLTIQSQPGQGTEIIVTINRERVL